MYKYILQRWFKFNKSIKLFVNPIHMYALAYVVSESRCMYVPRGLTTNFSFKMGLFTYNTFGKLLYSGQFL
jgi:hypothetical protein